MIPRGAFTWFANHAPWGLAFVFVAGVAHVATILILPHVATRNAFSRVSGLSAGPTLIANTPERAPPFHDMASVTAVCRFDLTQGPFRVRATPDGDTFLALAFHDRASQVFYATTDRAAVRGAIDILLVDARQLQRIESEDSDEAPPQELRITPPSAQGFVTIRTLIERDGDRPRAERAAQAVTCRATPS